MYFGETLLMSIGHKMFEDPNSIEQFILSSSLTVFSIVMNGLLFTLVFKFVHDGFVSFKTAFIGGLLTSVLLLFGQLLIKYYLQNYFFGSKAGVAGTILVLLVWMYYTSQIIFIGAKFTKVYAAALGTPILFKGRKKRRPKETEAVSGE
jgi:membrane protein